MFRLKTPLRSGIGGAVQRQAGDLQQSGDEPADLLQFLLTDRVDASLQNPTERCVEADQFWSIVVTRFVAIGECVWLPVVLAASACAALPLRMQRGL